MISSAVMVLSSGTATHLSSTSLRRWMMATLFLICPFHFSSFVKRIFAIRICYVAHDQSLILLHSVRKTDLLISIRSSLYQIFASTAARSIPRPFIYRSINALNPFTPSASGASVLPSFPLKTFSSRKSARSSPSFLLII